ncbi:MAG: hypothetical protein U0R68_03060 [Candidatus Nanopelagicales bacterium]
MIASLLDRPVRRAALAAGSCLVVAGALAACGSSASGDSAAASSQGADGFAAYRQCLSEHGITLPSGGPGGGQQGERPSGMPTDRPSGAPSGMPSGGPGGDGMPGGVLPSGVDASAFQSANEACASLRPTGGPGGGPGGAGIDQSALAAYRSCLSDHGVTVTGRLDQLSTSDPKTAAALTTCAPLRPTPSGAPAGSASPSSSA